MEYPKNSIINYEDILVSIEYSDTYNTIDAYYNNVNSSLIELLSIGELNKLFDNSSIGKKEVVIYVGPYKEKFIILRS